MPGMLDKDELKRRIDAFRTLRGLTQVDLAELFASKGHGSQELGRLERGALPLTEIRRRSLAEILGVPERWFVDQQLELADYPAMNGTPDAFAGQPADLADQLDRIEDKLDDNRRAMNLIMLKLGINLPAAPTGAPVPDRIPDLPGRAEAQRRGA